MSNTRKHSTTDEITQVAIMISGPYYQTVYEVPIQNTSRTSTFLSDFVDKEWVRHDKKIRKYK